MQRQIITMVLCGLVLTGCDAGTTTSTDSAPEAKASTAAAPRPMQARWWEWASAEPEATNPVADTTGEQCARNQPDDVWFLAGTFGGKVRRACAVPAGRPLVVPAINRVGDSEADCADFMAGAKGSVTLDGADVPMDLIDHEQVTYTAGPDNPVSGTAGETTGVGCGLWGRIDAPSPGKHTVVVHGTSGTFTVDATYTLTVA
ncbi:hypothetical protein [Actinoplanes palleronii]|nr:hypothetical protein [Actinoplanes palleronii]